MLKKIKIIALFIFCIFLQEDVFAGSKYKFSAISLDTKTNEVLYSNKINEKRYPASLTKIMTLYLAFEAIENGKLFFNQKLTVSKYAASKPKTNIGLQAGDRITVKKAMEALIIHSANDAAVVLAEALADSEARFGKIMTNKAHELGMNNTRFRNASGLPDMQQYTTAKDMATLCVEFYNTFPEYYAYFEKPYFKYNGKIYYNHNHVSRYYVGADGLKTGFTKASGHNIASSAVRSGKRVVAVIFGTKDRTARDRKMVKLLNKSFSALKQKAIFANNAPVPKKKPYRNIILVSSFYSK